MQEKIESKNIVIWCMILVGVVFITGRAHYFSPSIPKFNFFSFDARWWWNYQTYLENENIFANNIHSIENTRFPSDKIAIKLIVQTHRKHGISLTTVNLVVSTFIFLTTFVFLYLLGLSVMHEPKWSFFFALLVSQSAYVTWLRYPVFVPKMLGFMAFPLVLSAFINVIDRQRGYFLFGLIFMLAFMLYPTSIVYYTPALFISGIIYYICFKGKDSEWNRLAIYKYFVFFGLIAIVLLLLRFLMKTPSAPPIHIAEYYYKNHHFTFSNTFLKYVNSYGGYFLLCITSLFLILKKGEDRIRRKALLLFYIYLGCLFGALVCHILAAHVDIIRMLWFWRLAYYSYVPCLLVISIGVYQLYISIYNRSTKAKVLIWILTISLFGWVVYKTPEIPATAKGAVNTYNKIRNGTIADEYKRHMAGLWEFARQTPKESLFLMPHPRHQKSYTDTFEAETKRRCLLSRNEMGLMIVESELTEIYYNMLKEYDRIEELNNEKEYSDSLIRLAKVMNANYILHPRSPQIHRFQVYLPLVYQDSFWSVYELN